ncbi:lasso peptide biosynthesis B2 protein [Phenylobacterium deserti]|uniref:Lasso peptide biosynthesis B2 protein n=1 Tax=Phenylobacterium deserti TaxID=1914756 RepID=A0A328AE44_9CAUL|nr:lasso peptide biosynthesis B2 protein [Phenylobacterium deserti]RAK52757.1 lasso peptide biosynthesis B2 protein [Phenylobacterium deserti]
MEWSLAPQVHAAKIADDLVLLDLGSGAYQCLPGAAFLVDAPVRRVLNEPPPVLAPFVRPGAPPPPPLMLQPGSRAASRPDRPLRGADAIAAFRHLGRMGRFYAGRSVRALIEAAGPRPTGLLPTPDPEACAEIAAARRALVFTPGTGKCLLRSFLLLLELRERGVNAHWVFGVRTWPFAAHCWLQAGEVVLDDHPDRLRAFTPILVA